MLKILIKAVPHDNAQLIATLLGSFSGAFFTFIFFIIGIKYKNYINRKRIAINEHVYLERYLNHLLVKLDTNSHFVAIVKEHFQKPVIDQTRFQSLPLRFEAEMNLIDLKFINNYHDFLIKITNLNETITDANKFKEELIIDFKTYVINFTDNEKGKSYALNSFSEYAKNLDDVKSYIKITKENLYEIYAKNRFLLQYYKSWIAKKIYMKIKSYNSKSYRINQVNIHKKQYLDELEASAKKNRESLVNAGITK